MDDALALTSDEDRLWGIRLDGDMVTLRPTGWLQLGALAQVGIACAFLMLLYRLGAQRQLLVGVAAAFLVVAMAAFQGMGTGAYNVLLLRVTKKEFSATQYALLSSTYSYLGKILKGFSGQTVDALSAGRPLMDAYALFFAGSAAIGLPALILCLFLAQAQKSPGRAG